jgi:hypothetical protein
VCRGFESLLRHPYLLGFPVVAGISAIPAALPQHASKPADPETGPCSDEVPVAERRRPGIFAVGDARSHSIKRVASTVGEDGGPAVHQRLAHS